MLFEDTYKTIAAASEGNFKDKGSKFMAYAFPIHSDEQIKEILQQVKAAHPKARHYCWAMRWTTDTSLFRIQDDGEPSGSAGRPILNAIRSADLTNIIIVVVRYFGGTLLGIPGLIHAYRTAAAEAIRAAEITERVISDVYELQFEYNSMNEVMTLIKDEQLLVHHQNFELKCALQVEIRKSNLDRILTGIKKIHHIKIKYIRTI